MLRQPQMDGLLGYYDERIAELEEEMQSEANFYEECHGVFGGRVCRTREYTPAGEHLAMRVDRLKEECRIAEGLPVEDEVAERFIPTSRKIAAAGTSVMAVIGGMAIGMLLACCFLFENSEIAQNTLGFWTMAVGAK